MLTEYQYRELLKYRDEDIPLDGVQRQTTKFLASKKYVILYHPLNSDGSYGEEIMCAITNSGRQALEEYERQMREKCAEEEHNKKKEKAQRAANRFDTLTFGLTAAVAAGLIVYYWPSIVSFFTSLFQKISPP